MADTKPMVMMQMVAATPLLAGLWLVVYHALPPVLPSTIDQAGPINAMVLAIRCLCLAALATLALNVQSIALARLFDADAINPVRAEGQEPSTMKVDLRVLQNTLEQFILFAVGLLGLASYLHEPGERRAIPATSICWVVSRFVFWIGYHHAPVYRAAGVAGMLQNYVVLLYVSYRLGYDLASGSRVFATVCCAPFFLVNFFFVLRGLHASPSSKQLVSTSRHRKQ